MDEEAIKRTANPFPIYGVFVSTKVIKATTMTKFAWLEKGGTDTTNLDQPNLDGMLIIYPDGYESWCPLDVFKKYYRLLSADEINMIIQC